MKRFFTLLSAALLTTFAGFAQLDLINYIEAELSDTPDKEFIYQLPYQIGTKATAVAISAVDAQHLPPDNLVDFRAFEFRFKEPTDICAVRSGKVIYAEQPKVQIQHADGTVAEYAAFAQGSIRVEVGQEVTTGEKIGQSGHSLFSDNENVVTFELYHRMKEITADGLFSTGRVKNHYLNPLFRSQKGVKPLRDMKRYKAKQIK